MQIKKNEINKDKAWKYKAFAQINEKKWKKIKEKNKHYSNKQH